MGRVVADHVRDDQRQHACAVRRACELSAGESGEVLAYGVDVLDGCAGPEQRLGDLAQLLQTDAFDRRGKEAGAAA